MRARRGKKVSVSSGGRWRQRLWRYGPLLVWMAFISFASTGEFSADNTSRILRPLLLWLFPGTSPARLAHIHFLVRKAAHFTEYFIFALLAARALASSGKGFLRHGWFFISLVLVISYALIDEYHQSFVPTRTSSIYDSLIDMSGGLAALVIYALWLYRSRRRPRFP